MSDDLVDAAALIEQGDLKKSLELLERARSQALSAEDVPGLQQVLRLVQIVDAQGDARLRRAARRVAYAAQQNIRFLTRKLQLAAGERSVDATAPVPRTTLPRPKRSREDALGLAAIVLVGLVLIDFLTSSSGGKLIWFSLASAAWVAVATAAVGRWRSYRGRVWLLALALPLCFLGPIVTVALIDRRLRASFRRDLGDAFAGLRSDPPAHRLVVGLIVSISVGVVVFLAVLTLVALGGGDYNHYLYPHTYHVIVWIGEVPALTGVVLVTSWWVARGPLRARRLGLAVALSAASGTAIAAVGVWLYGQAGSDPRPTNVVRPSLSGIARVGKALTARRGVWRWPRDVPPSESTSPFSYGWERCERTALRCVRMKGANEATYVIVSGDSGHRLRVTVIATNDAGTSEAHSRPTETVVGD